MADRYMSLNCPEENDETRTDEFESDVTHSRSSTVPHPMQVFPRQDALSFSHPPLAHQTPFPSWDDHKRWLSSGSPHSLPSCLPSALYHTLSDDGSFFPSRPHSLPDSGTPSLMSLEHPGSLHSFPPHANVYHRDAYAHQCRPPPHHMLPIHHCSSRPPHPLYRPSGDT